MLCYFPATIKIYFRFAWLFFFYLVINENFWVGEVTISFKWAQKASVFGIKEEFFSLGSKTPFGW